MRKVIRIALALVAAFLLMLVVAALLLPRVVDPNDFRNHIEQAVAETTGRDFAIEGDIGLSFFPWLGLRLGAVEMGHAEGFEQADPFARIEGAQIRVRVLPLFRGRAEVDTLVLDGLQLHLARDATGRFNWDDLAPEEGPAADEPTPVSEPRESDLTRDPLEALAVGGLRLNNATISWRDAISGETYRVSDLTLDIGAIAGGESVPLALRLRLESSEPELTGELRLSTRLDFDLVKQRFAATGMDLTLSTSSPLIPGGQLDAELGWQRAAIDLLDDSAELDRLSLAALGTRVDLDLRARNLTDALRAEGDVSLHLSEPAALGPVLGDELPLDLDSLAGSALQSAFLVDLAFDRAELYDLRAQLLDAILIGHVEADRLQTDSPTYGGMLTLDEMNPMQLLDRLGIELPPMEAKDALSRASLQFAFDGSLNHFMTEELRLQLDHTTVTGQAGLARFDRPEIHFNLIVDQLDLDRYLPPEADADEAAEPEAAAADDSPFLLPDFDLPTEPLRAFDALGTLRAGHIKAAGLQVNNLRIDVHADEGRIDIAPFQLDLYNGQLLLESRLDATGDALGIQLNTELSGFQAGPLLVDLMDEPYVSGRTDLSIDIAGSGTTFREFRRNLNGDILFSFREGAVQGINLAELLTEAWARIEDRDAPPHQASETDFAALAGSISITDGLARNDDLALQTPGLRVAGSGTVNLVSEVLDYELHAAVVRSLRGQGGEPIDDLTDLTIPIHFSGTLKEPRIRVLLRELLEMRAREAAQRALEREQQRAQERLDEQRRRADELLQRERSEAEARQREMEERLEARQRQQQERLEAEQRRQEERLEAERRRQDERLREEQRQLEERTREMLRF